MTRGSNTPPPAQWNLQGWMAAYYAANNSPIPSTQPTKSTKKEEVMDVVMGGWQFEKSQGKDIDRPVLIRICTKCQSSGRQSIDIENWCQDCKEGKPFPGHEPEGVRPPSVSKDQDAAVLNKTFFG